MVRPSEVENFFERIKKIKLPVVVEGRRDKEVLEKFGFKKVFDISGKPLIEVVEAINKRGYEEVIILTDFDEEGKIKFKELSKLFKARSIKVNGKVRQEVKFLFRVGKIEELKLYLE